MYFARGAAGPDEADAEEAPTPPPLLLLRCEVDAAPSLIMMLSDYLFGTTTGYYQKNSKDDVGDAIL